MKIAEGASSLSRLDIRIDDNPLLTVADMNAKCRRIENLGLVVIDYLQLMTSAGGKGYSGENRQQAVSDISRMLKIMAKELQVPVLCLSQLSRANEKREDKRPMLSDLRESGAIEQDADIVMFLYRDDYYKEDSEKAQHRRVHRGQEPPRRDRQGGAALDAGVYHLRHLGKPLRRGVTSHGSDAVDAAAGDAARRRGDGAVRRVRGRDSVCLLHYLASLGRRRGFAVAAAHYNHLMRPTAGRDEAFVAGLCRELSVPLYVERGDVRAIARQEGWGVEEAGRRLRYDFLERTADAIGASRIATAHHLSDQAETVVLNLLRGTGPEGLAGIPPVRGRLIRPLLQTPRQEIEAYLTAHGLGHVEDETNDSMDFTRNRPATGGVAPAGTAPPRSGTEHRAGCRHPAAGECFSGSAGPLLSGDSRIRLPVSR